MTLIEDWGNLPYKLKTVGILVTHPRVDLNLQNNEGNTALIYAIQRQNWDLAGLLMKESRCQWDVRNRDGKMAVDFVDSRAKEMISDENPESREGLIVLVEMLRRGRTNQSSVTNNCNK